MKLRGQDLFDASVWANLQTTATFYRFIASLRQKIYDGSTEPSATHKFIRTLRDGGRLMRNYTQNIDGLESRTGLCMDLCRGKGNKRRFLKKNFEAPLPEQTRNTDFDGGCEVVPLHGDLQHLRCMLCQSLCEWSDAATEMFLDGLAPECEACGRKSDEREATGKRGLSVGSLRPNIVLYGEEHPSNTILTPLVSFDAASRPEVLIIMGTSLKVYGLQKVVRDLAKAVHSQQEGKGRVILVNRTRPAESIWDGVIYDYIAMYCDDWVRDLRDRRSDLWLRQGDLDLKRTKRMTKRKRDLVETDGANQTLGKKSKIVIEIPSTPSRKTKFLTKQPQPHIKVTPAPIVEDLKNPATPRSSYRYFKAATDNHPDRSVLSPLVQAARPIASPMSRNFKMQVYSDQPCVRDTPVRPPFSPITPRTNTPSRRMSKLWKELTQSDQPVQEQLGVAKSYHIDDKENVLPDVRAIDLEEVDAEDTTLTSSASSESPSKHSIRGRKILPQSFMSQKHRNKHLDEPPPVKLLNRITCAMGWSNRQTVTERGPCW